MCPIFNSNVNESDIDILLDALTIRCDTNLIDCSEPEEIINERAMIDLVSENRTEYSDEDND